MTTPAVPAPIFRPDARDLIARARWLAARARNALRHPVRIAIVGTLAFLGTLVFLVLLPGVAGNMRAALDISRVAMQDTTALATTNSRAQAELQRAESLLKEVRARVAATNVAAPMIVQFTPEQRKLRDSLAYVVSVLNRQITRVENSPLPQTYRSLGESEPLARNPLVQALLDSLADIEREREAFGAVSGVDPVYVALTSRATQIGRTIQGIAEANRVRARDSIAALVEAARHPDSSKIAPPAASVVASAQPGRAAPGAQGVPGDSTQPVAPAVPVVDSMPFVTLVDTAKRAAERAASALTVARAFNAGVMRRAEEQRRKANTVAPPLAILFAAIVLGLVTGFAFSLTAESGRPTVSDIGEAERLTGARVLAIVTPPDRAADQRDRRQIDQLVPPDLDPTSKAYRSVHLHLVQSGSAVQSMAVVGDEPAVAAAVASNVAAVAAHEARDVLVVDLDTASAGISSLLRIRPSPGTADVVARRAAWTDVITTAHVGRDRSLQAITAGGRELSPRNEADAAALRDELERMARRYDLCVIAACDGDLDPQGTVNFVDDVVLCARIGVTPLNALGILAQRTREAGRRVRGVVLWRGSPPVLHTREDQRTAVRSEHEERTAVAV